MRKLALFTVYILLSSVVFSMQISASTINIIGGVSAIKRGTAQVVVPKASNAQKLIVADYKGNTLKNVASITVPSGSDNFTHSINKSSNLITSMKFFLWNNFTDMIPLADSVFCDLTKDEDYVINITSDDIKQVKWAYGSSTTDSSRIGTNRAIPVTKGSIVTYDIPDALNMCIDYFPFIGAGKDDDGTDRVYWIGAGKLASSGSYIVPNDGYVAFTFCDAENNKNALESSAFETYKPTVSVKIPPQNVTNITFDDIESGGYNYGTGIDDTTRLRVGFKEVKIGSVIKYDVGNLNIQFNVLTHAEESTVHVQESGWLTGTGEFVIKENGYVAITFRNRDNSNITPSAYTINDASVSIKHSSNITVVRPEDVEVGGWSWGTPSVNTKRLRVKLIPVKKDATISYNTGGLHIYFYTVPYPGAGSDGSVRNGWFKDAVGTYTAPIDGYLGIVLTTDSTSATNAKVMTADDYTNYNVQIGIKHEPPFSTESTYPEGRRIIDKVNEEWTFVYLPEGYDANDTTKKYPLVIANHGNGWKMDGTEATANWTDITSYRHPEIVDTSRNHVGTENSDIWYSNATIEELLSRGYIVAGAENGQGALYGNDECRKACADFYNYMVSTYNIDKDNCFMIGASNGCMTTLNTAYYLWNTQQVKIKGVILQYPLCSLKTHYLGYSHHQSGIRTAYNVANDVTLTDSNFYTYISEEYDPERMAEESSYYPATLFCYSASDMTTPASINTIPLRNTLETKGIEYAEIVANGGHGDPSHFKPTEFANWLDTLKNKTN